MFSIKTYSFDSKNADLMFQDDEPQEVMTAENRRYAISSILRLTPIDAFTFEVANFSPVAIENALILATIEGIDSEVKLFKISKISAYAKSVVRYSFLDESTEFRASDSAVIDLSAFKESGIATDKILFSFTGENDYLKKLKQLELLKWEIRYHDYDPDNNPSNNWQEDIRPDDILLLDENSGY